RIYSTTSRDGGVTWTTPAKVDHLPDDLPIDVTAPSVVLSPTGEALVAWHDGRNGRSDIFLARSTDHGATWGAQDQRLDADEAGTAVSQYPRLAGGGRGGGAPPPAGEPRRAEGGHHPSPSGGGPPARAPRHHPAAP